MTEDPATTDSNMPGAKWVTHDELVEQAAKWLVDNRHSVVITDMSHAGRETPDVIGWKGKYSTLIECKTSRSDLCRDVHKPFRQFPETGMGYRRYMCTPAGLVGTYRLPSGWGLLEWDGKRMFRVATSSVHLSTAYREEVSLLISALRRIGKKNVKGISVRHYSIGSMNRATLGILPDYGDWQLK